jgi:hypothetical protein
LNWRKQSLKWEKRNLKKKAKFNKDAFKKAKLKKEKFELKVELKRAELKEREVKRKAELKKKVSSFNRLVVCFIYQIATYAIPFQPYLQIHIYIRNMSTKLSIE